MVGTRVESRPSWAGVIGWLIPAIGFFLLAAGIGSVDPAIFGLLPLAIAIALAISRPPATAFEITEAGLAFEPDLLIPYADIRGLTAASGAPTKRRSFPMQIYHPTGVVRVPAKLNVSSRDVFAFLLSRLPPLAPARSAAAPPMMRSFVQEHVDRFGAENVSIYRAREFPPATSAATRRAVAAGFVLTGIAWAAMGAALDRNDEPWLGVGIAVTVFASIFLFAFLTAGRARRSRNWQDSVLIVSPGGVALAQGPLKGQMKWHEVRQVEHPPVMRTGVHRTVDSRAGIGLLVDGAYILIADYYNRPSLMIYQQIRRHWENRA